MIIIEKMHILLNGGKRGEAIDLIYDEIDSLLLSGDVERASAIIKRIAEYNFPDSIYLSVLTVSRPWHVELEEPRKLVYNRLTDKSFADGLMS